MDLKISTFYHFFHIFKQLQDFKLIFETVNHEILNVGKLKVGIESWKMMKVAASNLEQIFSKCQQNLASRMKYLNSFESGSKLCDIDIAL